MAYVSSYLPSSVLTFLTAPDSGERKLPLRQTFQTVVLFADVSGFTAMCETLAATEGGDETLAKHLNSYFELLTRIMSSQGGDVFKFAGDAILVLWPHNEEEDLTTMTRRAAQCALEISEKLQDAVMADGVRLSVKVGVGAGECTILHIGGVNGRVEYLAIGEPLIQAFTAEHQATKREVVVSPAAWKLIEKYFEAEVRPSRHAFVSKCLEQIKKVSVVKTTAARDNTLSAELSAKIQSYIPPGVLPYASQTDDKWISELRRVTVMFINLGVPLSELVTINSDEDVARIHNILQAVQTAVFQYEGALNKFLMDDKGSTVIVVFGLPPLAHADDAVRGVTCALAVVDALHQMELRPALGITTGPAFCGVVGSKSRREYTVLGDTVNLAARLMQHATKTGANLLCDMATEYAASGQMSYWHQLTFHRIGEISVKGKSKPVSVFQPISKRGSRFFASAALQQMARNERQQDRHLDSDALIKGREQLLKYLSSPPHKDGSTILIAGGAKSGKTKLFMSAWDEARKLCELYMTAVNPYDYNQPFSVWRDLCLQLIDSRPDGKKNPRSAVRSLLHIHTAQFRAFQTARPPPGLVSTNASDESLLPCVNDVLRLDFEENAITAVLTPEARVAVAQNMMMTIIQTFASKRRLLLVVDDAQNMHPASWSFVVALQQIPNLVVLIISPPPDRTNLPFAAANHIPADYATLKTLPRTTIIPLSLLDGQLLLEIAVEKLSEVPEITEDEFYDLHGEDDDEGKWDRQRLALFTSALRAMTPMNVTHERKSSRNPFRGSFSRAPVSPMSGGGSQSPTNASISALSSGLLLQVATAGAASPHSGERSRSTSRDTIGIIPTTPAHGNLRKISEDETLSVVVSDSPTHASPISIILEPEVPLAPPAPPEGSMLVFQPPTETGKPWERVVRRSINSPPLLPRKSMRGSAFHDLTQQHSLRSLKLAINDLPDELVDRILERARGNAFVCMEFVEAMRRNKLISVEDHMVSMAYQATQQADNGAIVPVSLECQLGSLFDRLSFVQQMILRVASVIGHEFSFTLVKKAFPITTQDVLDALDREMQGLEELGIVRKLGEDDEEYGFNHGFMRDVVASHMLSSHNTALVAKLQEHSDMFGVDEVEDNIDRANYVYKESVLEGNLIKRGTRFRGWKKRYFILFMDKILYYKSKLDTKVALGDIHISEDTATGMGAEFTHNKETYCNFFITPMIGQRKYEIAVKGSASECRQWVLAIERSIVMKRHEVAAAAAAAMGADLQHGLGSGSGHAPLTPGGGLNNISSGSEFSGVSSGSSQQSGGSHSRRPSAGTGLSGAGMSSGSNATTTSASSQPSSGSGSGTFPSNTLSTPVSTNGSGGRLARSHSGAELLKVERDEQAAAAAAAAAAKVFKESVHEGYLRKSGRLLSTWKSRYFILFHDKLLYFKDAKKTLNVTGEIPIGHQAIVSKEDGLGSFSVTAKLGARKYKLQAISHDDAVRWIEALNYCVATQVAEQKRTESKVANHSALEGYLQKRGRHGGFQTRYCILFANKLEYLKDKHDKTTGEFFLFKSTHAEIDKDKEKEFSVRPTPDSKIYHFCGKDAADAKNWVLAIQEQAKQLAEYKGGMTHKKG